MGNLLTFTACSKALFIKNLKKDVDAGGQVSKGTLGYVASLRSV